MNRPNPESEVRFERNQCITFNPSPLVYAERIKTPTLIMHNDADGAVPRNQGIEFLMALKRNNAPSWFLVYDGEDYNLKERKNRKDLSIRLSHFFAHCLMEVPAPLWMTEGLPATEKGEGPQIGVY